MKTLLTIAVAMSLAISARGKDLDPADVLQKFKAANDASVEQIKSDLAEHQQSLQQATRQRNRDASAQLAAAIKNDKARLARAKKSKDLPIPELKKLGVGDVGKLSDPGVKVLQVIDASKMLVEYGDRPAPRRSSAGGLEAVEAGSAEAQELIQQTIRDQRAIPFATIMVEAATANITDGTRVNLETLGECWEVSKTITYPTASGATKTVLVIRPYDLSEVKKLWEKRQK